MVEAVGPRPISSDRGVSAVARVAVAPGARAVVSGDENAATLTGLAGEAAGRPPIDLDRIATLRRAVSTGSYSINPARIADRLIAHKHEWNGDDQA